MNPFDLVKVSRTNNSRLLLHRQAVDVVEIYVARHNQRHRGTEENDAECYGVGPRAVQEGPSHVEPASWQEQV